MYYYGYKKKSAINNNNKSFISDNSPYGYKKIYKTHIINKL